MSKTKYSTSSPFTYINTQYVEKVLATLGIKRTKLCQELGWNDDALHDYITYQALIPKEKRLKLAEYLHCSESMLINYQPTKEMIEKHKQVTDRKVEARRKARQSVAINNNMNIKDYSVDLLLEKINSLEKTIQLLTQKQTVLMEFLTKEFKKVEDRSNKQQLYILNELKKH